VLLGRRGTMDLVAVAVVVVVVGLLVVVDVFEPL
jgi:hypothetical protein